MKKLLNNIKNNHDDGFEKLKKLLEAIDDPLYQQKKGLFKQLDVMCDCAKTDFGETVLPPHGLGHCKNVALKIYNLLEYFLNDLFIDINKKCVSFKDPTEESQITGKGQATNDEEKWFLNSFELYILICSIYLHDIGMIKKRTDHALNSYELITRMNDIDIEENIKPIIANIARSHGEDNLEDFIINLKYEKNYTYEDKIIYVPFLMALLRLGDYMDWAKDRAPKFIRENKNITGESYAFWFLHSWIQSINMSDGGFNLEVTPKGLWSLIKLDSYLDSINSELDSCSGYLKERGIKLKAFKYSDTSQARIKNINNENDTHIRKIVSNDRLFIPFKSYMKSEYSIFYGRDDEANSLVSTIFNNDIILLDGRSGVGKSSLINCKIGPIFEEYDFRVDYVDKKVSAIMPLAVNAKVLRVFDQFERFADKKETIKKTIDEIKKINQEKQGCLKVIFCFLPTEKGDIEHYIKEIGEADIKYGTATLLPILKNTDKSSHILNEMITFYH